MKNRSIIESIFFIVCVMLVVLPKIYGSNRPDSRSKLSQINKLKVEEYFLEHSLNELFYDKDQVFRLTNIVDKSLVPLHDKIIPNNSIVFAFSPVKYHAYVLVKDLEYHGKFYPGRSFYRKVEDNAFRAGIFFLIKNINKTKIRKTRQYIKFMQGRKTDSCIRGALEVLSRGAGLTAPDDGYFPTSLVTRLKNQGFMDDQGNLFQVEAFVTNQKSFSQIIADLRLRELRYSPFGTLSLFSSNLSRLFKNSSPSLLQGHIDNFNGFPSRNPKPASY